MPDRESPAPTLVRSQRHTLQETLKSNWTAIEVGGGDGRLWASQRHSRHLWVIDPNPGVHERLRAFATTNPTYPRCPHRGP